MSPRVAPLFSVKPKPNSDDRSSTQRKAPESCNLDGSFDSHRECQ
jgi:hypothetical protein